MDLDAPAGRGVAKNTIFTNIWFIETASAGCASGNGVYMRGRRSYLPETFSNRNGGVRGGSRDGRMKENLLELRDISVVTDDGKAILNNISFAVAPERFVAITGPNGGGKSTLAKVIMGMMQPTSGKILFQGKDITDMDITERARLGVSFAFQQPVRFKGISVRDLMGLAAGAELSEQVLCSALAEVGLCARDYADRQVDDGFSGGEIKRVEIASIIARKALLTIFDEPEAGIDLWSFQNLIEVFRKIRKETKGSMLVISHQERILNIAEDIIVMADGAVTAYGKRESIMPALLGGETCCFLCPQNEAEGPLPHGPVLPLAPLRHAQEAVK